MKHRFILGIILAWGLPAIIPGTVLQASAQDTAPLVSDSLPVRDRADTATVGTTRDSAALPKISLLSLDSLRRIHSPRRAGLYSAVLPGLGQIYNRQYIKVPLMWAGVGVAAGIFLFDFDKYVTYRDAYRLRLNGHLTHDLKVDIYSLSDLKYLRDGYRQYVDYSVLGFAAVYLYNILDAIVFAHLYHFDISNDLSGLKFGPVFDPSGPNAVGLGFTYTFKK